jgi:hypothetical protein
MIFEPVSAAEMRAAQIATGVAMAGFIGAPVFGRWARQVRIAVTVIYIAAILGFLVYHLV